VFDLPDIITDFRDDSLKQQIAKVVVSAAYSEYITFLYEMGAALVGKRWIGWLAPVFKRMAASQYKLLLYQDVQKVLVLAVPLGLAQDAALLDSIYFVEQKQK